MRFIPNPKKLHREAAKIVEKSLENREPIDPKSSKVRFLDSQMLRFTVNGIRYGGYGSRKKYLAKEHEYFGHHGIAKMSPEQLLAYAGKLSEKLNPKIKRSGRMPLPLTELQEEVLEAAKNQFKKGKLSWERLGIEYGIAPAEIRNLAGKFRYYNLVGTLPKGYAPKPALRKVDANHPQVKSAKKMKDALTCKVKS